MLIDAPGAVDFLADADFAFPAVDLAIVVADPDPDKAVLVQPFLKALEELQIPRAIFINKIDTARPMAHCDGNYFADDTTLDQLEGEGRVASTTGPDVILTCCRRMGSRCIA